MKLTKLQRDFLIYFLEEHGSILNDFLETQAALGEEVSKSYSREIEDLYNFIRSTKYNELAFKKVQTKG